MRNRVLIKGIIVLMVSLVTCSAAVYAITLLTEDTALKEMFPDVDQVVKESITLNATQVAVIKERLGGSLVHYQSGSKSENVAETNDIPVFVGIKGGEKVRMAVIDVQPGKWGPVEFIIAIDTKTGIVNNLAVISYVEKRGQPIARQNFLKQFIGKNSKDPIAVRSGKGIRRDINAVSGATISSDATCFSVKKVLAIYEEAFAKQQ